MTEKTLSMPGTPQDEENDIAVSSTETSPTEGAFVTSLRQREVESEAATAYLFPKTPVRRSIARQRTHLPLESRGSSTSLSSMLPWNNNTVPTRKISVSSIASSTRPGMRRSSTALNSPIDIVQRSFEGLQRRPSQLSVRMRRESVAEKTKSHESLVQSPEPLSTPFADLHSSSPGARSHWSDNSDNEDEDDEPRSPVLATPLQHEQVAASQSLETETRTAAEEEEGSIHISMARRVSRQGSNAAMLPLFIRASKMGKDESASRRASAFSLTSRVSTNDTTSNGKGDLVRLVTALQATHLDETRRLNDIIASLSTKVAALERDLMYATASSSNAPLLPSAQFGSIGGYPVYSSPRSSVTGCDMRWKGLTGNGSFYKLDSASPRLESCGRRMSAISSSSPRTAAMHYI